MADRSCRQEVEEAQEEAGEGVLSQELYATSIISEKQFAADCFSTAADVMNSETTFPFSMLASLVQQGERRSTSGGAGQAPGHHQQKGYYFFSSATTRIFPPPESADEGGSDVDPTTFLPTPFNPAVGRPTSVFLPGYQEIDFATEASPHTSPPLSGGGVRTFSRHQEQAESYFGGSATSTTFKTTKDQEEPRFLFHEPAEHQEARTIRKKQQKSSWTSSCGRSKRIPGGSTISTSSIPRVSVAPVPPALIFGLGHGGTTRQLSLPVVQQQGQLQSFQYDAQQQSTPSSKGQIVPFAEEGGRPLASAGGPQDVVVVPPNDWHPSSNHVENLALLVPAASDSKFGPSSSPSQEEEPLRSSTAETRIRKQDDHYKNKKPPAAASSSPITKKKPQLVQRDGEEASSPIAPLNSRNFYYIEMRDWLLQLDDGQLQDVLCPPAPQEEEQEPPPAVNLEGASPVLAATTTAGRTRRATLFFAQTDSLSREERKARLLSSRQSKSTHPRKHRKVHGRLSFHQLNALINEEWKSMPEGDKEFYRDVAEADRERYKMERGETHEQDPQQQNKNKKKKTVVSSTTTTTTTTPNKNKKK